MSVFDHPEFDAHEWVNFVRDVDAKLTAIIAVHSTALGPTCGGTRMYNYATHAAALTDVLRLSRAMSYKSSMAGLPLGGGKAVIIGDPARDKSEKLFAAYGRAVDRLGGVYITAMDMNTTPADMQIIARHTKHVAGYNQQGKSGGDSGPMTALGVFVGIKAAVKHKLKTDDLKGMRVAVQGLGTVGYRVTRHLHEAGARLIVSDLDPKKTAQAESEFGAKTVASDQILLADADVVSPCALGAVLNEQTIAGLKAKVVAGGANNQLANDNCGKLLAERGILFGPDYVVNAGGIICVAGQIFGWSDSEIERRTRAIAETIAEVFRRADAANEPTNVVADRMARERIAAAAAKKRAA